MWIGCEGRNGNSSLVTRKAGCPATNINLLLLCHSFQRFENGYQRHIHDANATAFSIDDGCPAVLGQPNEFRMWDRDQAAVCQTQAERTP